jgi:hypothetical protein
VEDKHLTALRKAAHAVVAHALELPIKQVSLGESKDDFGESDGSLDIKDLRKPDKLENVAKFIMMSLAEVTAERIMQRGAPDDLFVSISQKPDWQKCRDVLTSLGFKNSDKVLKDATVKFLVPMLLQAWPAIQAIAETLLKEKTISATKVARILKSIPLVKLV